MEVETLKRLAMMGAHREQIHLSGPTLASILETSPQIVESRLASLDDQGYIIRTFTSDGQTLRITEKGILELPAEYQENRNDIRGLRSRTLQGKVASGMGKGRYYVSLPGYGRQFKAKLGFEPYPGTLNLKLDEPLALSEQHAIKIESFREEGRIFGGCRCYRIRINGIEAAIVSPDKSNHSADLLEVIAPVCLRESLHLTEGDKVELKLHDRIVRGAVEPGVSVKLRSLAREADNSR